MFKNYVKEYLDAGYTLEDLKNDYGVDTREVDGMIILSYSQIDSPKTDPLVRMCRGLVLEKDTWEIVNYPFNRFYNFEEVPEEKVKFNWDKAVATTKIDGSLFSVFWSNKNKKWYTATRSCIGGDNKVNDLGTTFNDLFEEAIKPFTREEFFNTLHPEYCYMFELVSPLNQIVTPYSETKLYCIGARNVDSYSYKEMCFDEVYDHHTEWHGKILIPDVIPLQNASGHFDGFEKMKALAESVRSKDEGFVVVDFSTIESSTGSFPRVKVKNSAYIALHHMRGSLENGSINFGEILSVVYKGEQAEVCSSLPQYKKYFDKVEIQWNNFCQEFSKVVDDEKFEKFWKMPVEERMNPENKKEFAMNVMQGNSKKFSSFLFLMFNKNLTSLKECIEFDNSKNIKEVLKGLWEKFLN